MGPPLITISTKQSSGVFAIFDGSSGPRPGVGILLLYGFPRMLEESGDPQEMAQYKYFHYLANLSEAKFDPAHPPGTVTPHTGIYKCQGCGNEIISTAGDPLPPPSHHQHSLNQGGVAWRLIVATA